MFECFFLIIIASITARFDGLGYQITDAIEDLFLKALHGSHSVDSLRFLQQMYAEDLDFNRLPAQLQVLVHVEETNNINSMKDFIQSVRKMTGERKLVPDVMKLLRIYLTLPSSNASSERSFSTLRRIKTYLRSSTSQERLNHLMLLNTYKDDLDNVNIESILREFIRRNDLRMKTFALPSL